MGAVAAQPPALTARLVGLVRQVAIIWVLDQIYEASRGIIPHQQSVALQNALAVVQIEKSWHIFKEWHLQAIVFRHAQIQVGPLLVSRGAIISVINHFYLYSHFLGTLFFLIWLFLFRREHFPLVRDIFFVTTGLALAIYIAFPMMPPRLMGAALHLPHGYRIQDTLAPIINYKLQAAQIGYNPYAAMPSLHFAWALILGATLVVLGRPLLVRIVGALYPCMMLATILISGNHLLLDAAGSVIVVAVATLSAWLLHRRPSARTVREAINRALLAA